MQGYSHCTNGNIMNIRVFQGIGPTISGNAYIDQNAVVIGHVTIGEDSSLWPNVTARGDVQSITIGTRTNIQDGTVLHAISNSKFHPGGQPLNIGNNVTIGHNASLYGCTIEDFVLIGMGAIILDGAIIKERALVAAGSVVPPGKVIEGEHLWMGNPAKMIRPLTEDELEYLVFSAQHYINLKNNYD